MDGYNEGCSRVFQNDGWNTITTHSFKGIEGDESTEGFFDGDRQRTESLFRKRQFWRIWELSARAEYGVEVLIKQASLLQSSEHFSENQVKEQMAADIARVYTIQKYLHEKMGKNTHTGTYMIVSSIEDTKIVY